MKLWDMALTTDLVVYANIRNLIKRLSFTTYHQCSDNLLVNKSFFVPQKYWWSCHQSCEYEAVNKARRAFFVFIAIGTFHGELNPNSTWSIYEVYVVPVLLFGCETWRIMTDSTLHLLESFKGEIGCRLLKPSKHHSTLSTHLALRWPSLTARIFLCKLSLLSKVSKEENNIGSHIFAESNQNFLRLVQEC